MCHGRADQKQPTLYGAVITAISMGIFRHMNRCPELPMTAANLAELTGAATSLISIYNHNTLHAIGSDQDRPHHEASIGDGCCPRVWARRVLLHALVKDVGQ
jgi:hypothetical protein